MQGLGRGGYGTWEVREGLANNAPLSREEQAVLVGGTGPPVPRAFHIEARQMEKALGRERSWPCAKDSEGASVAGAH